MNEFSKKAIVCCLAISASAAAMAEEQTYISNIDLNENLYAGLEADIALAISSQENLDGRIVSIGLKSIDENLSLEENLKHIDNKLPDIPLTAIAISNSGDGGSVDLTQSFTVPMNMTEGTYALVVTLDPTTALGEDTSAAFVDESDISGKIVEYAQDYFHYSIPELPSLEIETLRLAGSQGYTLSPESKSMRLNIELLSRSQSIYQTVDTQVQLSIPGAGDFVLPISQAQQQGVPTDVAPEDIAEEAFPVWSITSDCDGCVAMEAGQAQGGNLTLHLNEDVQAALQKITSAKQLSLKVTADSNSQVDEWQGNKKDNSAEISVYYTP